MRRSGRDQSRTAIEAARAADDKVVCPTTTVSSNKQAHRHTGTQGTSTQVQGRKEQGRAARRAGLEGRGLERLKGRARNRRPRHSMGLWMWTLVGTNMSGDALCWERHRHIDSHPQCKQSNVFIPALSEKYPCQGAPSQAIARPPQINGPTTGEASSLCRSVGGGGVCRGGRVGV